MIVLVDRLDEPHLMTAEVDQMRTLLRPMLDNKFLKNPGIGFKLLLPMELSHYIDREDGDPPAGSARQAKYDSVAGVDRAGVIRRGLARVKAWFCGIRRRSRICSIRPSASGG